MRMLQPTPRLRLAAAALAVATVTAHAQAQNPFEKQPDAPVAPTQPENKPAAPAAAPAAQPQPAGAASRPPATGGYRALARGVETTIFSPVSAEDRTSRHDLVEVLSELPNYGERPTAPNVSPAKNVHFKHDVWGLDFTFKPVRFLQFKQADGRERLVWYLVYHVRNGGEKPFLFIPRFSLESHDVKQTYDERLVPEVVPLIREREDKKRPLLNTAEITGEIPPSTADADRSVWGVAVWEGIDPRTDRFSILVQGLTNTYRWEDPPGAYQKGDPIGKGRVYRSQVLKLNFWRPSDTQFQHEEEIRFGIPGEVDYEWFYR